MKKPIFSVIIPTYNADNIICRTLDSVVNQTFKNFEIIIVDDCSTDGTLKKINGYCRTKKIKIKLIKSAKNHGAPAGPKNIAMQNARGKYFAFLDHDDCWMPEKLEQVFEIFNKDNAIAAVFSNALLLEDGRLKKETYWNKYCRFRNIKLTEESILGRLGQDLISPVLSCSCAVIDRKVYEKIGKFDERFKIADDLDYWTRIKNGKFKIHLILNPLTTWVLSDSNLSMRGSKDYLIYIEKHYNEGNLLKIKIKNLIIERRFSDASKSLELAQSKTPKSFPLRIYKKLFEQYPQSARFLLRVIAKFSRILKKENFPKVLHED